MPRITRLLAPRFPAMTNWGTDRPVHCRDPALRLYRIATPELNNGKGTQLRCTYAEPAFRKP
jgi:hypothetical protein